MSEIGDRFTLRGQTFTSEEIVTAGRVLGVLGDDAQDRAIEALRKGEFDRAKDEQRVADILRGMDVERLFAQDRSMSGAFVGVNERSRGA